MDGYSRNGNVVTLVGMMNTRIEFDQLYEMFRKTPGGAQIFNVVGGHQEGYDLTAGSVLTQYCQFDSDKLIDGWYLLLGIDYPASSFDTHWPFSISLFFLGTNDFLYKGYEIFDLVEETSDWEP